MQRVPWALSIDARRDVPCALRCTKPSLTRHAPNALTTPDDAQIPRAAVAGRIDQQGECADAHRDYHEDGPRAMKRASVYNNMTWMAHHLLRRAYARASRERAAVHARVYSLPAWWDAQLLRVKRRIGTLHSPTAQSECIERTTKIQSID